ncbi:LuxR C-terminal-related transcriptional regulator [Micromonospora aurantiaca (nom. illeg.)]|uniref:helix-turn-helix transcriptional regulator n=1 Tax=Micromonospora aurantiaca (nom. illeg.) TaxID=47850 RepID=UPI003EBDD1B1
MASLDDDPEGAEPASFVGRAPLLAAARRAVTAAADGTSTVLELPGAPGIGKTALLERCGRLARAAGLTVLSAVGRAPATYAMLAPLWRSHDGARGTGRRDPRSRLLAALAAGHSRQGGPMLLVDDAHLADASSLELVGELVRNPPAGLILVLAYRLARMSAPLAAALAVTSGRHERLEVPPLSVVEVGRMLAQPCHRAERIHALGGGNPLYSQAYRHLDDDCLDPSRHQPVDLAEALPPEVVRVLAPELALPPAERAVAEAAAVLGVTFDPALIAAMCELDPQDCQDLTDRLVAREVLRADLHEEPALRFRHPVLCAAVYQQVPPGRRRTLHATAARVLRELGHPPPAYADHLARSARPGDTDAARTLLSAAGHPFVPAADTVRWLSVAARLAPSASARSGLPPAEGLHLADALVRAGRVADGRGVLQDVAARSDGDVRAEAVLAQARVERLRGQSRLGYTLLRDLMPEPHTAPLPGRLTAAVAAELAICGALAGEREAARYAALARRAGGSAGRPVEAAWFGVVSAFAACYVPSTVDVTATVADATAAADASTDAELSTHLDVLALLGWVELLQGRETRAIRHFDRALRIATTARNDVLVPYLRSGRSCAARQLGLLDQARADAVEAERYADRLELDTMHRFARIMRTAVVYWQDGPAAALRLAEPVVRSSADDWFGSVVQRIHAQMRDECADRANTLTLLIRACGGTTLRAVDVCHRPYWAATLSGAARRRGDVEEARRWVQQAERHAGACDLPGQQAHVALARARIAMATDLPAAAAGAAGAAEAFAQLGWPLEEAAARLVHAKALDGLHDWQAAEASLAQVRRIAEACGARILHRASISAQSRLLGRAGRAGRRTSGPPADMPTLTRREREIVQLIATGMSNSEAAERLYVTVKTVEAHLTRIFRKVGVSSRSALIASMMDPGTDEY